MQTKTEAVPEHTALLPAPRVSADGRLGLRLLNEHQQAGGRSGGAGEAEPVQERAQARERAAWGLLAQPAVRLSATVRLSNYVLLGLILR